MVLRNWQDPENLKLLICVGIPRSTTMSAIIPTSAQSVDDSDPSISYSDSWTAVTGRALDFDATLHTTTKIGSSATFTFTGVSYFPATIFKD